MTDPLPRLHLVTDDDVLAGPSFVEHARAVLQAGGPVLALHVRGHQTATRRLFHLTGVLIAAAHAAGAFVVVNDRVDVARAAGAAGVQLGARSIPLHSARALLGQRWIGYSAHGTEETVAAVEQGTDFVLLGTIYASASHASTPVAGIELLTRTAAAAAVPVLAIGGVTPGRVAELAAAGAYGVAVLAGVWRTQDPAASVAAYVDALAANPLQRSAHAGNGNDQDRRQR